MNYFVTHFLSPQQVYHTFWESYNIQEEILMCEANGQQLYTHFSIFVAFRYKI